MIRQNHDLQARLVDQQPIDQPAFRNYQHAVDNMFVQTLDPLRRAHLAARILFGLAVAAWVSYRLVRNPSQPLDHLIIDAAIVLIALTWSAFLARDLLRGSMDRRKRAKFQAFLQLWLIILIGAATFIAAAAAPDVPQSTRILAGGGVFLVITAMLHLRGRIREARMDLEQHNLELQLRIATLTDGLDKTQL